LNISCDNFSLRCSYVDYDGAAALKAWNEKPPVNGDEEVEFVQKHCPLVLDGINNISRYLEQISLGDYPRHF
jgi:hypothetical protein